MEELKRQIRILEERVNQLSQRPNQVTFLDPISQKLIIERIDRRVTENLFFLSAKGVTSERQAVNEAGVATYNVLKEPDAYIEIALKDNTTYYLPAFTSLV